MKRQSRSLKMAKQAYLLLMVMMVIRIQFLSTICIGTVIHGAKAGHKYDAMLKSDKVSFCVIDKDEVVPDKVTNYFRSVVAFGRVKIIEDEDLRKEAALAIGRKFSPEDAVQEDMRRSYANVVMYEISIEHLTGKEAIELVAMKAAQDK